MDTTCCHEDIIPRWSHSTKPDLIKLNGEINAATLNLDPQPIAADDNKNLFRLRPHEEEHTITELALMHFLQPPALNYKCSFYDR